MLDLRRQHALVEAIWAVLVLAFGWRYHAALYVAAYVEPEERGANAATCPSAASCGSFAGWMAFVNIFPSALVVLGALGALHCAASGGGGGSRDGKPPRYWPLLYRTGSALGLLLVFVQVFFVMMGLTLLAGGAEVATVTDAGNTTVLISTEPLPVADADAGARRRRTEERADDEIGAAATYHGLHSHSVGHSNGEVSHASCIGENDATTEACTAAFEASSGWEQVDCVGAIESPTGCIYVANNEYAETPTPPVAANVTAAVAGMCQGNTDGSPDVDCVAPYSPKPSGTAGRDVDSCCALLTCADVVCSSPKVPNAVDPSSVYGSTVEECCICAENGERDLVDAYCVSKDDPDPLAENSCTNVMKYVGCGTVGSNGLWESQTMNCIAHPELDECAGCVSEAPFREFQRLSETGSAQDLCMDADRYGCRYVFRRSLEQVSCREGMCFNNTYSHAEPDIVCPAPSVRMPHALEVAGRSEAECCTTKGMCIQDTDGSPDIECEFPARLRPRAEQIVGRDQAACCYVTEMCVGNSDQLLEPNVKCEHPSRLRSDAHLRFSRVQRGCGGCCVTHSMCVGNDICDNDSLVEEDVQCALPAESVPDAVITRGRDTESCCQTVGKCVGNSDGSSDVHCAFPAVMRRNPDLLVGRTADECCVTQGMCVGNSNRVSQPDIACAAPSVPREHTSGVGRDVDDCCVVTGYCAGNTDSDEEDIVCDGPRTPKVPDLHELQGRSMSACCDCFEEEHELSASHCVRTDDANPSLDNSCTRVMKYAGCDDVEACVNDPTAAGCAACATEDHRAVGGPFQILARDHSAQNLCMATTARRYDCTYIFDLDVETVDPCLATGKCIGNSDLIAEPDVQCSDPKELRHDAHSIDGNGEAECCSVTGMCVDNSDGSPDVVCPAPSALMSASGEGRTHAECCVTHGMCIGNTRAELEPNFVCPDPWQPRDGAATIHGRSKEACCWCEEKTVSTRNAYCFKTNLHRDADNECTEVMRYANCPRLCLEQGRTIAETEAQLPECTSCAEEPPYATWQELSSSDMQRAQETCAPVFRDGDVRRRVTGSSCTYEIRKDIDKIKSCDVNEPDPPEPERDYHEVQACDCDHGWSAPEQESRDGILPGSVALLFLWLCLHFALRLYGLFWDWPWDEYQQLVHVQPEPEPEPGTETETETEPIQRGSRRRSGSAPARAAGASARSPRTLTKAERNSTLVLGKSVLDDGEDEFSSDDEEQPSTARR